MPELNISTACNVDEVDAKVSDVDIMFGRGITVNQHALIHALASERIGGAIIDVFDKVPLGPDSPVWSVDNLVVTPHNSAYSFAEQVTSIFAGNYRRYVENKPLKYQIHFDRGYELRTTADDSGKSVARRTARFCKRPFMVEKCLPPVLEIADNLCSRSTATAFHITL